MSKSLNPKHHVKRAISFSRRANHALQAYRSVGKDYIYSIDSPRKKLLDTKLITVEGWILAKDVSKEFTMRVRNNDAIYNVEMGLKRLDVAKAHPELPKKQSLYSGFSAEFEFEDGKIAVELENGKGFKKLYQTDVSYGVEQLPATIYNKDLSNNIPEHVNLLDNRQVFYYEDRLEGNYIRHDKDPRLMAIYLPQFHPFEENDKAWGRGFTEWTNVSTGQPRFIGHQQPILPKDLGFYDLRLDAKILEQIELAKKYGVYGFCFYYYWFSGTKLMERPIESFIAHKEWDFNFSICWANENWTKRWDGRNNDIIIAQKYEDDDPLNFIKDVEHILLDPRYIREGEKPVLMVYRASELKDPARYANVWREYFRKQHKLELQLVSYLSFDDQNPQEYGFDAALDFAPLSAFFKNRLFEKNQFPYLSVGSKLLDVNFSGVVADYRTIALNEKLNTAYDFPVYDCVTPSWDNDARKKGKGFVYQNSSPDVYAAWLKRVVTHQKKDAPFIFINAWNEWAEGAIMEPSMHLGHAVLNRTVEVLAEASLNKDNKLRFPAYSIKRSAGTKLAVAVHLYYVEMWPYIMKQLENIPVPYDLFVTLNKRDAGFTPQTSGNIDQVHCYVMPNRGRDVLPFLYVARRIQVSGYEYILKLHSKKSKHREDGSTWFSDVLTSLTPDPDTITAIFKHLDDNAGMVGPLNHAVSLKRHMGSNKEILKHFITKIYDENTAMKVTEKSPELYPYFGGTMFWARVDAFSGILGLYLMPDDFQSEHGQIDGTAAHAIERLFGAMVKLDGKKLYVVSRDGVVPLPDVAYEEKYTYAP
jgi:lipopolysaccharide biosynthesis protein